jgi:hypothetical protein
VKRPGPITAALAVLAVAACVPEDGPLMDPGKDCLECHGRGEAPGWTFAGTVFQDEASPASDGVRGVKVHATDADGRRVTVASNEAGNFYLADRLAFPLRVAIERGGRVEEMELPVEYGGCNLCHAAPPRDGAAGRLAAP